MIYSWTDTILYFFAYSFCGWLMETVLCSIQEKRFVNRGFLNGPLCPIYGCGGALIFLLLLPVRDAIASPFLAVPLIFIAGVILASAVEYTVSYWMERCFHARWWDYSHCRFNLNGRICLSISLVWGVLATGFVYIVQPLFELVVGWLYSLDAHLPLILAVTFCVLTAVDAVISVFVARAIGNKLEQMEKLRQLIQEHTEGMKMPSLEDAALWLENAYDRYEERKTEMVTSFRAKLGEWRSLGLEEWRSLVQTVRTQLEEKRRSLLHVPALQKRMIKAFPKIQWKSGGSTIEELRDYFRKKK